MKININNFAKKTGVKNGKDYFVWRVFVDEPGEVLDKIKSVQYLLHPSFPNPLRISEDRKAKFALDSSGWGEFQLQITINFVDGTIQETSYVLDLKKPWPTEQPLKEELTENLFFVNGIPSLYEALEKSRQQTQEIRLVVKNFLISSFNEDLDEKVERFLSLPSGIFPADTAYFKIFWELNELYVNGLFYSTVVMAGVLCENICYDILDKHNLTLKPCSMHQLIQLLRKNNLVKSETLAELEFVANKRIEYIHPRKADKNTSEDATRIIKAVTRIMSNELTVRQAK